MLVLVVVIVVRAVRVRDPRMAMPVRVRKVRVAMAVGARLRLEGLGRERHLEAELTYHVVQHVIVQVSEAKRSDLNGDVAVAQVIGRARQFERIARGDDRQAFQGGLHLHDHAVLCAQAIAVLQIRAAFEEQRGFTAVVQTEQAARLLAGLVVERDGNRCCHGSRDFFYDLAHLLVFSASEQEIALR